MDTDWESRYRSGDMPWEKGEAAPGLLDFLSAHPELPRGTVLVPGCGTGHDARAWAKHGFKVTGVDLAPSAITLARERTEAAGLNAEFRIGNFLEDGVAAPFDYLFEHTLFCAIRPEARDKYAAAAAHAVKPGGMFVAIHYMLRECGAEPPHGVAQEELIERFSPSFELIEGYVPRSYPNRTGLELLLRWKRRLSNAEHGTRNAE